MTAVIVPSEVTELSDPKVRKIAMRVVREVELSLQKSVAHQAQPEAFPMSRDPGTIEQLLRARVQQLRPEQQQLAAARILPRVQAPAALRGRVLGDLARVDLRSPASVEEQSTALALPPELKIPPERLQVLPPALAQAVLARAAAPAPITDNLELRIHSIRCVDETGSGWLGELGKDDISLGGTTVDESGDTKKIPEFKVGGFNDGTVRKFMPPRRFALFNLREGTAFPKSYFVTLVLAEKDLSGGLADFLNKLLAKVRERVIVVLSAAIGGAIGASGGPIGAIIGAAVGFVVGKVFELLRAWFADDIFPPKTLNVAIPSLTHRFARGKTDSPESIVTFAGHEGKYQLVCDWRLVP